MAATTLKAEAPPLLADAAAIETFLATTVRHAIQLVWFEPDSPRTEGRWFGTDVAGAVRWALAHNAAGRNIHWTHARCRPGVHKKPGKDDLEAARFCHLDSDPPKDGSFYDREGVLNKLGMMRARPSFVVDSGGGLQPFWRLEEEAQNRSAIEDLNKRLIRMFDGDKGGDKGTWNIDRVMRVPGTVNWPDRKKRERGRVPVLASIAVPDAGQTVTFEELHSALPPLETDDGQQSNKAASGASAAANDRAADPVTLKSLGINTLNRPFGMITQPKGVDRSGDGMAVAGEMVRRGFSDAQIAGVLLNPYHKVSAHYFDQADPRRAAERSIDRARKDEAKEQAAREALLQADERGVSLRDFYAHMPTHTYIFAPSREFWPAVSVNSRIEPVAEIGHDGEPVVDAKGNPKTISASAWLDRNRAVEQVTWAPGKDMVIADRLISDGGWINRPGCATFNLYRPPLALCGDAASAGLWIEHVRRVYAAEADHIIKWLAHRVQRPQQKINHAIVLGGSQGIGKDTLLEPVKQAIGPWNFAEVSPQHMLGRFNGFVKSVILRVSEARDLGDVDRFAFYDHMKTYTAAPPDVLRVDEKHLREYAVFNVCGVIITSNHKTDGERLAQGESLVEICRDEHMPGLRTAMRWARENREFSIEYELARAAQAEVMDDLIVAAAKDASSDPHAARVKIDAYKWRASKLSPKRYGDKVQHTAGDGENPVQSNVTITFRKAGEVVSSRTIEGHSRTIEDHSDPD